MASDRSATREELPEPQQALTPIESIGERHRVWIEAGLVVIAAFLSVFRTAERDFWFHLGAGRSIAENGIPSAEPWCLAAFGQWPWLGEWIFHLGLYSVYSVGGDWGIALWRAGWTALAMVLALALARMTGAGILVTALVTPVVLAVSRTRFLARPEQLTLVFVLLFLAVFEYSRRSQRNWAPWLIVPQIIWASIHPMWVLGPMIAAGYAAFEVLPGTRGNSRRALHWGVLAVVLFASAAISPRPVDTLTFKIVRDAAADPAVGAIEELKSWSAEEELFGQYSGILVLAAAALVLGGAYLWRTTPMLSLVAAAGLIGGFAIFRFRALAVFIALSVIAAALTRRGPPQPATDSATAGGKGKKKRGRPDFRRARKLPVPVGVALGVLATAGGIGWLVYDSRIFEPGVEPYYYSVPVRAVEIADSLGLEGPVLNTPWYGGYIYWSRGRAAHSATRCSLSRHRRFPLPRLPGSLRAGRLRQSAQAVGVHARHPQPADESERPSRWISVPPARVGVGSLRRLRAAVRPV